MCIYICICIWRRDSFSPDILFGPFDPICLTGRFRFHPFPNFLFPLIYHSHLHFSIVQFSSSCFQQKNINIVLNDNNILRMVILYVENGKEKKKCLWKSKWWGIEWEEIRAKGHLIECTWYVLRVWEWNLLRLIISNQTLDSSKFPNNWFRKWPKIRFTM